MLIEYPLGLHACTLFQKNNLCSYTDGRHYLRVFTPSHQHLLLFWSAHTQLTATACVFSLVALQWVFLATSLAPNQDITNIYLLLFWSAQSQPTATACVFSLVALQWMFLATSLAPNQDTTNITSFLVCSITPHSHGMRVQLSRASMDVPCHKPCAQSRHTTNIYLLLFWSAHTHLTATACVFSLVALQWVFLATTLAPNQDTPPTFTYFFFGLLIHTSQPRHACSA